MRHKILTDYRDDGIVEVAIDLTNSDLGKFEHTAYVHFLEDGSVRIPFSGDRHVIVGENGVSIMLESETLAYFAHEE